MTKLPEYSALSVSPLNLNGQEQKDGAPGSRRGYHGTRGRHRLGLGLWLAALLACLVPIWPGCQPAELDLSNVEDFDGDGYSPYEGDCADREARAYPGAEEVCDGIDNNCDGEVDEGVEPVPFYRDADRDGFGEAGRIRMDCAQEDGTGPAGYVAIAGDCDDLLAEVYPGAPEDCDDIDDDCDGEVDNGVLTPFYADVDGDGFGDADEVIPHCYPAPAGYVEGDPTGDLMDCDDSDETVYPGAPEYCNEVDDDCDGETDTHVVPGEGYVYYLDADGDGFGAEETSYKTCNGAAPEGYVTGPADEGGQFDCDDGDPAVRPGVDDTCDEVDNNCDGEVDEDFLKDKNGHSICESCNGLDDDRNGQIDEIFDRDGDGYSTCGSFRCELYNCKDFRVGSYVDVFTAYLAELEADPDYEYPCERYAEDDPEYDPGVEVVLEGEIVLLCGADCNDEAQEISPGAWELCDEDGVDENCNGVSNNDDETIYFPTPASGEPPLLLWYPDKDMDTYGASGTEGVPLCEPAPSGYATNDFDCDDRRAGIAPGVPEVCNTLDDDCDGKVDEGVGDVYYLDYDGDGYGDAKFSTLSCGDAPDGYVENAADCDDFNSAAYPRAPEKCDLVDNDCDGNVDDNASDSMTFYRDLDGDSYGTTSGTMKGCTLPAGYAAIAGDCNDNAATTYPGATELCNGFDDNCDNSVDEGLGQTWYSDSDDDGYGNSASSYYSCAQPDGYTSEKDDCNDSNASVHPNAQEKAGDEVDSNCDGQETCYKDGDSDGYRPDMVSTVPSSDTLCEQSKGEAKESTPADDCNDGNKAIHPGAPEQCNSVDDDCDGSVDEDTTSTFYTDADGDTYGDPAKPVSGCSVPSGASSNSNDCDDTSPSIHPGATETCNGKDDNCNNSIDDPQAICERTFTIAYKDKLCPTHTAGDEEFGGNGPKTRVTLDASISSDARKIELDIEIHIDEWDEDDGVYKDSRSSGTWSSMEYTAEGSCTIADIVSTDHTYRSWIDDDTTLDTIYGDSDEMFEKMEAMGDTDGDDIGQCNDDRSYVSIWFRPTTVRLSCTQ